MFIPVKTYLSYNEHVVFGFILTLSYYFRILFWSFLFFRVTFKVELICLLTILELFVLYTKALRMIGTVIHIGSRTHTCSYLLGTYIFVFILRKNCTLYDCVDSNCVPPVCTSLWLLSCNILFYSYHTWEVWVYFTRSFALIRKYN